MKAVMLKPDEGCLVKLRPGEASYLQFTVPYAQIYQVACAGKGTDLVKARILKEMPEAANPMWGWDSDQKKRHLKQEEERLALSPPWQLDTSNDEEATEDSLDAFLSMLTLSGAARADPPPGTRFVRKGFVLGLRAFAHAKTPIDLCVGVVAWVQT